MRTKDTTMHYFLEETARHILSQYPDNLHELCVVFPNRRSGRFFQRYLAGSLRQPVWSPTILTITDLMEELSGLQKADQLSLVFDLHQVFQQQKPTDTAETFDQFFHWGEMLLRDFDDIDKYLADPKDVFRNLARLKSIDEHFSYLNEDQIAAIQQFWDSLDLQSPSSQQQDFISIWEILYNVYVSFNQGLEEKGVAYEGKIYRTVADRLKAGKLELQYPRYLFVGFNALTPAEKSLFHELTGAEKADFYWDYDRYYLEGHEAGHFLRSNLAEFPSPDLGIHQDFAKPKNIRFINTAYDIAQAKILPRLLEDLSSGRDANPDRTAIVLPDEQLLLPVLNSLPEDLPSINVTMGYPVDATPAFSFLLSLIQLQKNVREKAAKQFYYKDVLAILNHQYMGVLRDERIEALSRGIHKHNKIYLAPEELHEHEMLQDIFTVPQDYASLSDYLLKNYERFYRLIKEKSREQEDDLLMELESIYHVYLSVKRLKEIFSARQVEVKTETYLRILERVIMNQSIPFRGEPLSGLQVMGILETRTLDFENLIILSMNEGVFPTAESAPSFIPFNLRKGFGLPTHEQNDAIYAYYFYRLIQRARNVTLVYNSSTDGLKTGEMSRFMHQLKYEGGHPISEETVVSDLDIPVSRDITVTKSKDVMEALEQWNGLNGGKRKLSPSALNTYLRCPLQFYFKYVAGLEEPEEITEDVDMPLFGTLLHHAMERMYEPYVKSGEAITAEELQRLEKNDELIRRYIRDAFREEYFSDVAAGQSLHLSGKNLLIEDILHRYIKQLLRKESKFTPFRPLSLEGEYNSTLRFEVNDGEKEVTLRGKIDRVDEHGGAVRVLDYKTGQSKGGIKDVASLFARDGNHAALQALLYARMYDQNNPDGQQLVPGLYFLRDIYRDDFDYRLMMNKAPVSYHQVAGQLEEQLKELMQQLYDPDIPFEQTEDWNTCRFCPYNGICRRKTD